MSWFLRLLLALELLVAFPLGFVHLYTAETTANLAVWIVELIGSLVAAIVTYDKLLDVEATDSPVF